MDIGSINRSLKLEFGVIVNTPKDFLMNKNGYQTVSKFSYDGRNYIKLRPSPFILLKIKSEKNEGWNINNSISFNSRARFEFLKHLKKFLMNFSDPDLFYYTNNHTKLEVNPAYRQKCSFTMSNSSNKTIRMEPAVISPNNENADIFYEGAILYINGYDNYAYLTYAELEYMYNEIREINMRSLSLLLLAQVDLEKDEDYKEIKISNNITKVEEPELSSGSLVTVNSTSTIPKI